MRSGCNPTISGLFSGSHSEQGIQNEIILFNTRLVTLKISDSVCSIPSTIRISRKRSPISKYRQCSNSTDHHSAISYINEHKHVSFFSIILDIILPILSPFLFPFYPFPNPRIPQSSNPLSSHSPSSPYPNLHTPLPSIPKRLSFPLPPSLPRPLNPQAHAIYPPSPITPIFPIEKTRKATTIIYIPTRPLHQICTFRQNKRENPRMVWFDYVAQCSTAHPHDSTQQSPSHEPLIHHRHRPTPEFLSPQFTHNEQRTTQPANRTSIPPKEKERKKRVEETPAGTD